MKWEPISTAGREPGREVLGCKYQWDGARMVMVREPFVSVYSEKMGKFTNGPTHWVEAPEVPFATAEDKQPKRKGQAA
jgi:hypothetical protein